MSDLEAQSATFELHYIKMGLVPEDTECYQVENGRTFYFKKTSPQRLYVKDADWGDEINAKLPNGRIKHMAACGNEVYFSTENRKIYKAVATILDSVVVTYVRHVLEIETITCNSLCMVRRDNRKRFFRMSDYEEDQEINLVDNCGVITGPKVHSIHRGKIVFVKCNEAAEKPAIKSAEWRDKMRITVPPSCGVAFAQDTSKYIYLPAHGRLHVLDTETDTALPALSLSGLSNITVVGIRDRVITLTAEKDFNRFLVTVKLPEGYFDSRAMKEQVKASQPTNSTNYWPTWNFTEESPELRYSRYSRENADDADKTDEEVKQEKQAMRWEHEMSTTINELLDKNAELSSEIESMTASQKSAAEMVNALKASNKRLEKESAQMTTETQEMQLELEGQKSIFLEIEAANEQLTEEMDILMQQLEKLDQAKRKQTFKNQNPSIVAKNSMSAKLALLLQENGKLIKSIAGESNNEKNKELLTENELVLKQVGRV